MCQGPEDDLRQVETYRPCKFNSTNKASCFGLSYFLTCSVNTTEWFSLSLSDILLSVSLSQLNGHNNNFIDNQTKSITLTG